MLLLQVQRKGWRHFSFFWFILFPGVQGLLQLHFVEFGSNSISILPVIVRKGGWSGEKEEDDECEPEALPSFAEAHAALAKVKSFFYALNISERDEENILNVESALFGLKRKVSTNQLSTKDFFGKKK
ncbi:hypothetical protein L798_07688 [Zootermopsis nevadensis]|uniref:Centromere protein CENP-B C-terminal domain-containing protein n=1 Tax=Zootermopsis nevadensis TaxID=136037 RepID=A0A067REJ4_ZOONE|nr:hypothetical protein L798_07688 [Zootermopsis nevadensis]